MTRHSDLMQLLPHTISDPERRSNGAELVIVKTVRPSGTGLLHLIRQRWTGWLQARHLRESIDRLANLSDHLLDDAGLNGPIGAQPNPGAAEQPGDTVRPPQILAGRW